VDGGEDSLRLILAAVLCVLLSACGSHSARRVIVLGVDGMDPAFTERHWADLPNLVRLRDQGSFSRLATTNPPQSPVAWSTFMTGLSPDKTGIFDFIHRDPSNMQPYLSMDKTVDARWSLPLGPYRLPLSPSRVVPLRKGRPFWETLAQRGIPVIVMRIPANYPPSKAGKELAGMGVPDLRGTEGTYTYFTDDPSFTTGDLPGGEIRVLTLNRGHADLSLEGPPNTLRPDGAATSIQLHVDVDPELPYVRIDVGDRRIILKQGEWSEWIKAQFALVPRVATVSGMFRVYAKQLRPALGLYVSPVNADPGEPALPLSSPASLGRTIEKDIGTFGTLGIPEDTAAARQNVLSLDDFVAETNRIAGTERKLLDYALAHFERGLLFFYFSTVDQSSHMLWGKHEDRLVAFYRKIDDALGEVMRREPGAAVIVMSDHGFATFDRAVNLNTWLLEQGWLTLGADGAIDWTRTRAYALGLNGLYLNLAGREQHGIVAPAGAQQLKDAIRAALAGFRDPESGRSVVSSVTETQAAPENRNVAPDLIVGYSQGYRASWETALAQSPRFVIEDNNDLWIGDHCIDPAYVPGVLFAPRGLVGANSALGSLAGAIMRLFPPDRN
jgi:predicted AlkP superfamily phosphohydrolase/phosphomutase